MSLQMKHVRVESCMHPVEGRRGIGFPNRSPRGLVASPNCVLKIAIATLVFPRLFMLVLWPESTQEPSDLIAVVSIG